MENHNIKSMLSLAVRQEKLRKNSDQEKNMKKYWFTILSLYSTTQAKLNTVTEIVHIPQAK